MQNPTKLNRGRWAVRLLIAIGLALLFLAAWLGGFKSVTPARADPGTLYVDDASGSDDSDCSNPADPCATIGYAIAQAGNGDTIQVAQGTYTENPIIGISVTLEGGYEAVSWTRSITQYETIVYGSASTTQSVVRIPAGSFDVGLDGLTITGGDKTGADGGGGIVIWSDGSVVIANSIITGNVTNRDGGGLAAFSPVSLTLTNLTVANNAAGDPFGVGGGLYFRSGAQVRLTGVRVVSNAAAEAGGGIKLDDGTTSAILRDAQVYSNTTMSATGGGGIAVSQGSLVVSATVLRGNHGAIRNNGMLTVTGSVVEGTGGADWTVWSDDHLMMDDCIIRRNGTYGIVHIRTGQAAIHNTMIVDNDNAAANGDIIGFGDEPGTTPVVEIVNVLVAGNDSARPTVNGSSPDGSMMLMNVTVAGNSVPVDPILAGNGTWTVINSIVWGNTAPGGMLGLGTFSVSYSDIEGGWTGTGNIDADPRFVDAASGDYHLGVGSPCIDQGTAVAAPTHDIGGTPRDAAPDMGAYEWRGFRVFLPLTVKSSAP
jgi:hypothetical protein